MPEKPSGGGGGKSSSIQTEIVNFDVSKMSSEEVDQLRLRLREVVSGLQVGRLRAVQRIRDSHSSHTDTDGWI